MVTAIVTVGADCPFNSPGAIYRAIIESFQLPSDAQSSGDDAKGLEVLLDSWIRRRIHQLGAEPGSDVPELVQRQIEQQIGGLWKGAPDPADGVCSHRPQPAPNKVGVWGSRFSQRQGIDRLGSGRQCSFKRLKEHGSI